MLVQLLLRRNIELSRGIRTASRNAGYVLLSSVS